MLLREGAAIAALVALALTSGCTSRAPDDEASGDPSPVVRTTPPTTATPTPTPAPTPESLPAPPPERSRADEVGAAAAVTYYVELYPFILATGDFAGWNSLSAPDCEFCRQTREYVSSVLSAGGSFDGGTVEANVVKVHPADDLLGGYPVDVDIVQEATVERDVHGDAVASNPEETMASRVDVVHTEAGWKVLAVYDRPT